MWIRLDGQWVCGAVNNLKKQGKILGRVEASQAYIEFSFALIIFIVALEIELGQEVDFFFLNSKKDVARLDRKVQGGKIAPDVG